MKTDTNDDLAAVMQHLREPMPPASLRATVMARIARDADRPHVAPLPREQPRWLLAIVGLAVVLGAVAYGWFETGVLPDVLSPRIGDRLALVPAQGSMALLVGLGLLIYMAGLVGPLRSGDRR